MTKTTTENSASATDSGTAESVSSETSTENSAAATECAAVELTRDDKAMALVNGYVPWSACAGLVPLPGVDMAALVAVQLRMLCKLSEMYEIPFKENVVKGTVSTLLGAVVSNGLGGGLGALAKAIPVIGPVIGVAVVPGMYSAATYAVGRVFVSHFEAGGTFLDFDPKKMRAFFVAEFEKAKGQPDTAKAL
ncbi:MAG: DUF697 domain-containing protein [Sulfuricella sp.]|nr:DUF697 domain-containing protein [Sulfuricella sp.]